jgi:hypothetical protein
MKKIFVSFTLAALALGCGGRYRNTTGDYRGPNILDFRVETPVQRVMPQERNDGSATVYDDGGDIVTFELRIFGGAETPCQVQAQRSRTERGRMDILPGQQCTSTFRYDGHPVAALMQVQQGTASFDRNRCNISMQGPFAADVVVDGNRVVPTTGFAIWRFEGWR